MAANELTGVNLQVELATEIDTSLFLGFTTTVGQKNVGTGRNAVRFFYSSITPHLIESERGTNSHFNTVGILAIDIFHRIDGFRNGFPTLDQDAIDVKCQCKIIASDPRGICQRRIDYI